MTPVLAMCGEESLLPDTRISDSKMPVVSQPSNLRPLNEDKAVTP